MSEPTTNTTDSQATPDSAASIDESGSTTGSQSEQKSGGYTPPATQADLDRIIADRVARTKNQFKDYGDLKTKAAQFDEQQLANQTDLERATSEVTRWQTEAETWRKAAVGNRIEALAATAEFADASDAIAALAGSDYLDAGGQIDEARIAADLADVLERKPHYRRVTEQAPVAARPPAPNRAQGSSGGTPAADPRQEFAALLQTGLGRPIS